ncbi:MAG: hypothetical protein E6315_04510, partial [Peptoniphilus harei]|nr:hypothetical protein [Peptoniphilus harei]
MGWDKALELSGENIDFTAIYEPIADVIPIDPEVTPDDKLQEDKPEDMVLVEFVVDEDKAYMDGTTKYYVAKNKEVEVPSPMVFNKNKNDHFKGWRFNDEITMEIKGSFAEDTKISDKLLEKPNIHIMVPTFGINLIKIEQITDGAEGKLEVISDERTEIYESKSITIKVRRGRRFVDQEIQGFQLKEALEKGDVIKFWATNENGDSEVYKYIVH